ncbi:putative chaperone protein [Siphonobacter sp. BAB-5404]|nr:putative chaperone protein [Siphonobacter sp. SORGH_AS_0500]
MGLGKLANYIGMTSLSCGIDFGTSNSSIALAAGQNIHLVPVENGSVTMPSALFFNRDEKKTYYGRAAMQNFLNKEQGRLMRSLKRILGTPIMKQGTFVHGRFMNFSDIIGSFINQLKVKADEEAGFPLTKVVMGRPVHFIDQDPASDRQAQTELEAIARSIGFEFVEFQYEPIAAAFAHEVTISGEKLALVVDLGGGTSDFTVIRLSNKYLSKTDRSSDILANTGVRVGGNDFDKALSLAEIMPEIGYKTTFGPNKLDVPLKPFHDLSEWSKVNFLYNPKMILQVRNTLGQSQDKTRYGRLLKVLEQESGHTLLAAAEQAKIELTHELEHTMSFDFLESGFEIVTQRSSFETAITNDIQKITASANECLSQAGVKPDAINLIILTGGSTEVPAVQQTFRNLFPQADIADENKLSSVGLGLAFDSKNKFGA